MKTLLTMRSVISISLRLKSILIFEKFTNHSILSKLRHCTIKNSDFFLIENIFSYQLDVSNKKNRCENYKNTIIFFSPNMNFASDNKSEIFIATQPFKNSIISMNLFIILNCITLRIKMTRVSMVCLSMNFNCNFD